MNSRAKKTCTFTLSNTIQYIFNKSSVAYHIEPPHCATIWFKQKKYGVLYNVLSLNFNCAEKCTLDFYYKQTPETGFWKLLSSHGMRDQGRYTESLWRTPTGATIFVDHYMQHDLENLTCTFSFFWIMKKSTFNYLRYDVKH